LGLEFPVTRAMSLDILRSSIETRAKPIKDVLLIGNPNKGETASGELVGMSEEYTIELELPFAENEVLNIQKLLQGEKDFNIQTFFAQDATKLAFIDNSKNKSLIHFVMVLEKLKTQSKQ